MAHIRAIAWCENGQKIVIAIGSPHNAEGCVALLTLISDGVKFSTNFIGYARPKAWSTENRKRGYDNILINDIV